MYELRCFGEQRVLSYRVCDSIPTDHRRTGGTFSLFTSITCCQVKKEASTCRSTHFGSKRLNWNKKIRNEIICQKRKLFFLLILTKELSLEFSYFELHSYGKLIRIHISYRLQKLWTKKQQKPAKMLSMKQSKSDNRT